MANRFRPPVFPAFPPQPAPVAEKRVQVGFGAGSVRTEAEGQWCRNRPRHARPPMPKVGDLVLFRSNDWFSLVDARVLAIFWECENGFDNWESLAQPDPWPMLRLEVAAVTSAAKLTAAGDLAEGSARPRATIHDTWEARLEGSAGWLPLDWERWPRPIPGRG